MEVRNQLQAPATLIIRTEDSVGPTAILKW